MTTKVSNAMAAPLATYEVDFSALASNSFSSGDGAYNLGGTNWSIAGKATATTLQLTNGTGIEMVRGGTDLSIRCSLKTMFPNIAVPWQYRARIWIEFVSGSILVPNNFCWMTATLAIANTPGSAGISTGRRSGSDAGSQQHWLTYVSGVVSSSNGVTTTNLTDNVYELHATQNWNAIFATSTSGAAWDDSLATFRGVPAGQGNSATNVDWTLFIVCSSGSGVAGTVKKVRVELYR
jgi:hypothetical protein